VNLSAFESSSALDPIPLTSELLELIGVAGAALIALVFVAYLLRCYFQEFRRAHHVRNRRRLARLSSVPGGADRKTVVERCLRRRALVMPSDFGGLLPQLDWHGLQSLIPLRDRVTLVWDTARANDGALPRLCIGQAAEDEGATAAASSPFDEQEHQ
jgi:hypothetical protein